ncbi:MAG TPA: two-component regulator propeller domain-containing protein, partial [Chitinophagaceae bacterium]
MNWRKLLLYFPVVMAIQIVGHSRLMAQDIDENNFTLYTKQDGLSQNIITGIAQDSVGYVWLSTTSGLNRFNGSSFVQFHSTTDSLSLPEEYLTGLVWLDKNRLATYPGGLHIIGTRSGETRNLFIPYSDKKYQHKFNMIMDVASDSAGDIFILSRSGFYHYDKNYHLVFRFDYYKTEEVPTTPFVFGRNLLRLDDHRLAITSIDGIYYYNIGRKQFKKMDSEDCREFKEFLDYPKTDYEFFQQKPGHFFITKSATDSLIYINIPEGKRTAVNLPFPKATDEFDYRSKLGTINDTLLYITGKLSGFYKIRLYPESGQIKFYAQKYFPFYYCRDLLEDRDNNLWIATNKGLLKEDNIHLHIQQAAIPASLQDTFPTIVIDDICAAGNKLFVATRGYGGVLVFDKHSLELIRRISFKNYWRSPDNIYSIVNADDSTLLVGTNGPLFRLNIETGRITEIALDKWDRQNNWIADLYKDRKNNIWIATSDIYKFDNATKSFSVLQRTELSLFEKIQQAYRIDQDAEGNIWMAGHGLLRYNTTSKKFDKLIDSFPFIKMADRQVNSFTADQQNNLWLNSNNNGLICYNIDKGTFRHFTRDDGLPDNTIASMIVIGNKLWIACYSGIACLDLQTFRITAFGKEDGFPDMPIPIGAKFFYDNKESKLYIGFTNTLVKFDPAIIFQRGHVPHLFIESLVTGSQKKISSPAKNITTSWKNNAITITIGTINFFTSSTQRFAYRLVKDNNMAWQQLGTQNTFSISNLSAGYHRIQVKIFSLSNRWPEQVKEIDITVLPPFWKKPWFIAISVIILVLCGYLLFIWRTGLIRKKERAKTHIERLKAEEYKNQFELEQISNYFSSSMAGKKNVDDVLWDVMKNLIGRMNYEDCIIYMWNEDRTRMIQKAAYGPKGDPTVLTNPVFDVLPGQGLVGHVMLTKEPLLVPDTRKDSRYRLDDMMRLSELCVPIIHNNELIGIIDSEHHLLNHFKERDIKILTTIATLV